MAKYFAYEAEMPTGEFRKFAFRESLSFESLLFACHDTTTAAPARTISAVFKYRCSEQETIVKLDDVEIVQFLLLGNRRIVSLHKSSPVKFASLYMRRI